MKRILGFMVCLVLLGGCAPLPTESAQEDMISYQLSETSMQCLDNLMALEAYVTDVLAEESDLLIYQVVLYFLRKDRYGYLSPPLEKMLWDRFAGTLETEGLLPREMQFSESEIESIEGLVDAVYKSSFLDPVTGDEVDLAHMFAVVDLYVSDMFGGDYQEVFYDALFSWGGDLESLLIDLGKHNAYGESDIRIYLGTKEPSHFSVGDWLADIDGLNIAQAIKQEAVMQAFSGDLLSKVISNYYQTANVGKRNQLFVNYYGGIDQLQALALKVILDNQKVLSKDEENQDYQAFLKGFQGVKRIMLDQMAHRAAIEMPQVSEAIRRSLVDVFIERLKMGYE